MFGKGVTGSTERTFPWEPGKEGEREMSVGFLVSHPHLLLVCAMSVLEFTASVLSQALHDNYLT